MCTPGSKRAGLLAFALLFAAADALARAERGAAAPAVPVPIVDQADVFSDRAIRTWALEMPEGRWRKLREDARSERWAAARLRVGGVDVGVVGVRFKGASGTLEPCFRDGEPICAKLPMKLRFDRYDPKRRFFGLQRLNFHSMLRDPSLMRERLAYRAFEEAGIAAPRTAWARVSINGRDLGLFALVEAVDARFSDRRFHYDDGLLYKEAWPGSMDVDYYERQLRSNRGGPHDHAKLLAFAHELAASPPDELAAVLERWTDPDYLMRYMAVDRLIGNWDGINAWYCDRGTCWNHNYYWYVERKHSRFWPIPWDLDNTFLLFDPLFPARDWLLPGGGCDERPLAWGDQPIRHPTCDRLAAALAALGRERFVPALREVLASAFDPERLRARILAWRAMLAPEVARDPNVATPAEWEAEVGALLASIGKLRARGEALARGEPVLPFGLDLAKRNDFEATSQPSVWRSVEVRSNPRSRVAHGLGLSHALAGRADLRLDFELRDESRTAADRFLQWASLNLPFAGGRADLRSVASVRLRLRADEPRTVRIDVESTRYPGDSAGLRYGWDVAASSSPRSVALAIGELALPAWSKAAAVPLDEVLAHATGLSFHPQPVGRLASGFFPSGGSDPGSLRIDDLEFLPKAQAAR